MSERRLYVYRLLVDVPPDRGNGTGWEPPDFDPGPDPNAAPWQWPRWTRYLSYSAAKRRADLLTSLGATVRMDRSEPVVWPVPRAVTPT